MKDLILIIDMQNIYLPGQEWACPSMPASIKNIRKLLDAPACGKAYDVIFTTFKASTAPTGQWKEYNETYHSINESDFLNDMIPELKPYLKNWPLYEKSTYSSLSVKQLRKVLPDYKNIVITGVVAECCVLSTVLSLIDLGSHIIYVDDAISGQSAQTESFICELLLQNFFPIHGRIMHCDTYLESICQ